MNKASVISIFLRSLTIQLSFNFRNAQGLGFAFSMLPLRRSEDFVVKHLRVFNTNPYLAPAIAGSVLRIEEKGDGAVEADDVKSALMGPYAAIGDSFFWGALRLFSSAFAVLSALCGGILAPLAFMLIFSPAQLLVRINGFIKGYERGKDGFNYLRDMDLLRVSSRLHYASLFMIGILTILALNVNRECGNPLQLLFPWFGVLVFLFSFFATLRRISTEKIIYGVALLCMVVSY
jgi:mannose/fructose/N-acetylgalactosamine-specific phosphotransferase system component IID